MYFANLRAPIEMKIKNKKNNKFISMCEPKNITWLQLPVQCIKPFVPSSLKTLLRRWELFN